MGVVTAAKWLHAQALAEWKLLKEAATFHRPDKALLARLGEIDTDGGLLKTCELVPTQAGQPREARLLLQLDGDALLFVPKDFATQAEDTARVAKLQADVADELARLQAALPYHWAALVSVATKSVFSVVTAYSSVGGAHSLMEIIGQVTPETFVQAVPLWHVVGTLGGVLGLGFGPPLRRGLGRLVRLEFR